MKIDKIKSQKNKWRISEKTFVFLTILLGGIGIIFATRLFNHKTKKYKFKILIPIIIIIQITSLIYYSRYLK